jgi:hypothetical protein
MLINGAVYFPLLDCFGPPLLGDDWAFPLGLRFAAAATA